MEIKIVFIIRLTYFDRNWFSFINRENKGDIAYTVSHLFQIKQWQIQAAGNSRVKQ